MSNPLTCGSLFAGLGGFDIGFEQAGFQTRWQVEIDPNATGVLARHWPDVTRYGDIRTVDPADLEPVDVITFGSPCQDLSVSGLRKGLAGERSGLFYEAIRILAGVRPRFAVWENVPGAFSSNGGRDFAAVLTAFRECGAREFGWRTLDAQYFGVAQRRRRVFLVADFRGTRACEILFESEGVPRHPPSRPKTGNVIASLLASGAGTERPAGIGSEADFCVVDSPPGACDVSAGEESSLIVTHSLRAEGFDGSEDGTGRGTPIVPSGMRVRRLTPVECERLMGLDDDWTRWTGDGRELSDSARYRLVGNAVAVPVVR